MSLPLERPYTKPSGKRKAQVFTIRISGLPQPTINYGSSCALSASLVVDCFCSVHFPRW